MRCASVTQVTAADAIDLNYALVYNQKLVTYIPPEHLLTVFVWSPELKSIQLTSSSMNNSHESTLTSPLCSHGLLHSSRPFAKIPQYHHHKITIFQCDYWIFNSKMMIISPETVCWDLLAPVRQMIASVEWERSSSCEDCSVGLMLLHSPFSLFPPQELCTGEQGSLSWSEQPDDRWAFAHFWPQQDRCVVPPNTPTKSE